MKEERGLGAKPWIRIRPEWADERGDPMRCDYCQQEIKEEEMKNETFVWIREFRYGRKMDDMKFTEGGLSIIAHQRCFGPVPARQHACEKGLIE